MHWITGKDRPTTPVNDTRAPVCRAACVIDVEREVAADPDFLRPRRASSNGKCSTAAFRPGRGCSCHRVEPTNGSVAFLNAVSDGPHSPGFTPRVAAASARGEILGVGVETIGTDAGAAHTFDPPFPQSRRDARRGQVRAGKTLKPGSAPATGAVVIAAPLKVENGSGSPPEVLALVAR